MTTSTDTFPTEQLANALHVNFGAMANWKDLSFTRPDGEVRQGKLWIKEILSLSGTEVSLSSLPPGGSIPYDHIHDQNEELYIFLSGKGQMKLDDKIIEVTDGSVVRVDPKAVRCWRNTGDTDLVHLVIQSKAGSLEQWTAGDGTITTMDPTWGN